MSNWRLALPSRISKALERICAVEGDTDDCGAVEIQASGFTVRAEYGDWKRERGGEDTGWYVTVTASGGRRWGLLSGCLASCCRELSERIERELLPPEVQP